MTEIAAWENSTSSIIWGGAPLPTPPLAIRVTVPSNSYHTACNVTAMPVQNHHLHHRGISGNTSRGEKTEHHRNPSGGKGSCGRSGPAPRTKLSVLLLLLPVRHHYQHQKSQWCRHKDEFHENHARGRQPPQRELPTRNRSPEAGTTAVATAVVIEIMAGTDNFWCRPIRVVIF